MRNDLIRRRDAIEVIRQLYIDMGVDMHNGIWNKQFIERMKESDMDNAQMALHSMWERLTTIPPADRQQGEWESVVDDPKEKPYRIQCSACTNKLITYERPSYCPNCGALMRWKK